MQTVALHLDYSQYVFNSPVCVGPGQKPRRPVFSQRGSFTTVARGSTKDGLLISDQFFESLKLNVQVCISSLLLYLT